MDVGLQKRSKRIVHQTVPLYQRFAGKHLRHNTQIKVPSAAPTGVAGVGRAVIANL
jgi:hypothetical protein